MPRKRKGPQPPKPPKQSKRKVAEDGEGEPPKHKAGEKSHDLEIQKRELVMNELVLRSVNRRHRIGVMQQQFPGISEAAIDKLFTRVNQALEEDATDLMRSEKLKLKRRILGHIHDAKRKGNFGAVMQGERLYAEICGAMAPIKHAHEHSFTQAFESAFKMAVSQLSEGQIKALLAGETVPLATEEASPIDTSGEEMN